MKTKIIPFDLEMARKIQAGEIKGKIIYNSSEAEILDFKLFFKGHTYICAKTKGNSGEYTTRLFNRYGKDVENNLYYNLTLEVPDNEPQFNSPCSIEQLNKLKKYTEQLMEVNQGVIDDLDSMMHELRKICDLQKNEFKPFDRVLVRDDDNENWETAYFSHIQNHCGKSYYRAGNINWNQCIPYEGNEHLVGTTDKPKEE